MFHLCSKLKALKPSLRSLNKCYGNIHQRVAETRDKLLSLQLESLTTLSGASSAAIHVQECLLAELSLVEESFLRQKYRVQWLNEGDQNTKFFIE